MPTPLPLGSRCGWYVSPWSPLRLLSITTERRNLPGRCPLLLYCYKVQNRDNFPMQLTVSLLLLALAASSVSLPLSLFLAVTGGTGLLLDLRRA